MAPDALHLTISRTLHRLWGYDKTLDLDEFEGAARRYSEEPGFRLVVNRAYEAGLHDGGDDDRIVDRASRARMTRHAAIEAIEVRLRRARVVAERWARHVAWLEGLAIQRRQQIADGTWPSSAGRLPDAPRRSS